MQLILCKDTKNLRFMNNCSKYIVFRLKNIQVLSLHSIIFNKFRNIYCDF